MQIFKKLRVPTLKLAQPGSLNTFTKTAALFTSIVAIPLLICIKHLDQSSHTDGVEFFEHKMPIR